MAPLYLAGRHTKGKAEFMLPSGFWSVLGHISPNQWHRFIDYGRAELKKGHLLKLGFKDF